MEENKNAKRRETIKTILIIFLALLLVLTFFSNTILNYSLPTVTAQYAGYGTISEKVRGSGIVTANQNYDVNATGSRKVASVHCKVGDEVKAGDILFVLEAANSDEEIKTAEDAIRDAELAYQKSLLTAAPTYAKENQEIADARADLQKAINALNAAKRSAGASVSAAEYQQAAKRSAEATSRIAELSGYLTMAKSGELSEIPAQYTVSISAAQDACETAAAALADAAADLEAKTAALTVTSAEQEATVTALERAAETAATAYERAKADYEASGNDIEMKRAMEDAESAARYAQEDAAAAKVTLTEIQQKEAEIQTAKEQLALAQQAADDAKAVQDASSGGVVQAIQADLDAAQNELDAASATMNAYDAQGETQDISALEEAVSAQERNLQSMILALSEAKKEDDLAAKGAALDLQSQQLAITRQKEALEKLKAESGTLNVTSKNSGVVNSVNVAAGDEVGEGMTLAAITLTDSGYTLSFTATAEQARKVKLGTLAEVTNNYYSDITAKLIAARADTSNPTSQDKTLVFEITGKDVTPGQMLALTIPCSSQSYDCVVPSSAINEDNDGKFVLVMQAKSTPLGNRFYATRVNVTVLAQDEVNSAVQGDVNASNFIITASEKPLKPGDQVREAQK